MNRKERIDFSAGSLWVAVATGIGLFASLSQFGCAAPVRLVTNVVHDSDVQGCSRGTLESRRALDVAVVIDTSLSTRRPAGIDVDRDGRVGPFTRNSTYDRPDSRLAAEIAALRPLLRNAAGQDIRFAIVTYSGASSSRSVGKSSYGATATDSRLKVALTRDSRKLDRVLDEVLTHGSSGSTVFYGGMIRAFRALRTKVGVGRRQIVLFIADAPRPTLIDSDDDLSHFDPRMKNAAIRARDQKVIFHTFGLSPDADSWRHTALGQIAGATGGNYHAVQDPSLFYCHLASAVAPPSTKTAWERVFARRKGSDAGQRHTIDQ